MSEQTRGDIEPAGLFGASAPREVADAPKVAKVDEKSTAAISAALSLGAKSIQARCNDLKRSLRITDELLSTQIGI